MEKKVLTLELPKESYEVGLAIKGLMLDIKEAKKDGWSTAEDVPAILIKSLQRFIVALEGIDKLDDEYKENAMLMVAAIGYPSIEGVLEFVKKEK